MSRYTGPKDKVSRREGKELFGRKTPRRINQPPGVHGAQHKRTQSEGGKQLREKQAVKLMYGLREKQFRNLFERAKKLAKKDPERTPGEVLLQMLESRLDNVVYRLGLARTKPQARQFVTRGYILVDGKEVNIPSYHVDPGQKIQLKPIYFSNPFFESILKEATELPEWLRVEGNKGYMVRPPERNEIRKDIDEDLIVSFYSK